MLGTHVFTVPAAFFASLPSRSLPSSVRNPLPTHRIILAKYLSACHHKRRALIVTLTDLITAPYFVPPSSAPLRQASGTYTNPIMDGNHADPGLPRSTTATTSLPLAAPRISPSTSPPPSTIFTASTPCSCGRSATPTLGMCGRRSYIGLTGSGIYTARCRMGRTMRIGGCMY